MTTVTRENLYQEVWAEPMTTVAARYNVSSSFLARICERLSVPRPPRGYWAKLAVGKKLPQPNLPEARPGDELEWSRNGIAKRMPHPLPKAPDNIRPKRAGRHAERSSQHPLLVGAQDHFDAAKTSDTGHLRPLKKLLLDVIVSKDTLSRALNEANTLFQSLEDRGHQVCLTPSGQSFSRCEVDEREQGGRQQESRLWWPARPTVVYIGTVAIGLTLFETTEEIEMIWQNGKEHPVAEITQSKRRTYTTAFSWTYKRPKLTGRLCLQAYSPYMDTQWTRQWREAKAGELPSKFRSVVRELEREAATIAQLAEEAARRAEIKRQQREAQLDALRREEAERQRLKAIKDSQEELFGIIDAWAEAKRIDEFFKDAELRAAGLSGDDHAIILDRLRRARELLGGIDALARFRKWRSPEER